MRTTTAVTNIEAADLSPEWKDLHDNLPPFCTRYQLATQSNLIAAGTIANRDAQKRGIAGKMSAGNKVVYPRLNAVLWLMDFVNENMSEGA